MKPKALSWLVLLITLASLAHAGDVDDAKPNGPLALTSNDLINESFRYDNKTVLYRGEVVGPVMVRGENAWVNIYDGTYAVGVWCPAEYTEGIKFYGDYNHMGDGVEVTGLFHRTCTSHGGDLDIHCDSLKILTRGHEVKHPVENKKIYLAVFLFSIAIILILIEFTINSFKVVEKWIWDELSVDLVQLMKEWGKDIFRKK